MNLQPVTGNSTIPQDVTKDGQRLSRPWDITELSHCYHLREPKPIFAALYIECFERDEDITQLAENYKRRHFDLHPECHRCSECNRSY